MSELLAKNLNFTARFAVSVTGPVLVHGWTSMGLGHSDVLCVSTLECTANHWGRERRKRKKEEEQERSKEKK